MDLVLELPGSVRWAIEIKRSPDAVPSRGFHQGRADLEAEHCCLVHSGQGRHPLGDRLQSFGLPDLMKELAALR